MTRNHKIVIIGLIMLDLMAWGHIVFDRFGERLELYFLDVGQGDSEMIVMPGRVKLLIDGGPDNGKAARQLDRVMPWYDRYIDVVMISHAELDHFGGLLDVVQRYEVGVLVYNGQGSDSESFKEFARLVKAKQIPVAIIGEGGVIAHASSTMRILSTEGKNRNEGAIVARFTDGEVSALFTGDIGKETEAQLVRQGGLKADILKVPHHGSKFSSTEAFLRAVKPKIAVIEVGKNSYGHPTKEVLERLRQAKTALLRTDRDGMVRLVIEDGVIKQYKGK